MSSHRTGRMQRIAAALFAALGLVVVGGSPARAERPAQLEAFAATGGTYLALGDSVPFGFRPDQSPPTYGDPRNFTGSPEIVGADLHLNLLNAACPGETTDSFIDATSLSYGCENHLGASGGYRASYPLHVPYDFPQESQLDYAVRTLQRTPDVRLVTVQVGANDGFVCGAAPDRCGGGGAVPNVADHVRANVDSILRVLRDTGRYAGPIVVVSYYAPDYRDGGAGGWQAISKALASAAAAHRAILANGFEAFRPIAEQKGAGNCMKAGLLIPNDFHPTLEGQRLLAHTVELALAP
jgi:lysophospholipase L1-like esterase